MLWFRSDCVLLKINGNLFKCKCFFFFLHLLMKTNQNSNMHEDLTLYLVLFYKKKTSSICVGNVFSFIE